MNAPAPTIKARASIRYEQLSDGGIQLRIIAAGPPYGDLGDHVTLLTYKQLKDLNVIKYMDKYVYMFDRRMFNKFYAEQMGIEKEGIYDGRFAYTGGEALNE